jgi:branched-chain amino acid transport system permease protein
MTEFIQNLIDGLGKGSTYALLAVGVSMLFGVMHLVNFAHGELLTVSAYVMFFMRREGVDWVWVIPVAVLAAVVLSVLIEFTAFRRVRNAGAFTLLLTSFALEILSHAIWRTGVSAKPQRYTAPDITTKTFSLGSLRVEWWDLLRKTIFGLSIRAAAEDFDAARLMGVRANRVISGAFAFAGLLAGIAGIFFLVRRGQADPRMGAEPLLKGVIAAAIGGLGSIQGAVVGGLALGVAEVYAYSLLPKDLQGMYNSVVFGLIVILFVVRPQGLFNVQNAERV